MTIKFPQPLKFHKKTAQLQIDLVRPKEEEVEGKVRVKDGCLFLSLAKAKEDGSDRMDWDNKINMKLDPVDIAEIVTKVRKNQPAKLFHKSEAAGSTTTLDVGPGEREGTYKWFINKTVGGNKNLGNIYLDQKDMFHIFTMFEAALPVISGWVQ
jgi:hypothetical protein